MGGIRQEQWSWFIWLSWAVLGQVSSSFAFQQWNQKLIETLEALKYNAKDAMIV